MDNKQEIENFYELLTTYFIGREDPDYESLKEKAICFNGVYKLPDDVLEQQIKRYQEQNGISKTLSHALFDDDNSDWIKEKISNFNENFPSLTRYLKYLEKKKHLSSKVVEGIKDDTKKTILKFANPDSEGISCKRGMVVGDVQSGKTSNYIAVINAAIDLGYKNIIILAGLTESLRIQTQKRIDDGVTGIKSDTVSAKEKQFTGIGNYDNEDRVAISVTNVESDFVASLANSQTILGDDLNKPRIFVVKKNKSSLTRIGDYLNETYNKNGRLLTEKKSNLLVIDDECDNASINTKTDDDPTTYNKLIRNLMRIFKATTYLGYTATPYGNIFINPEAESKDHIDDLFPKDFIVLLGDSSDYFGYKKCFASWPDDLQINYSSSYGPHIVLLDEREINFLPSKHKKTDEFTSLPLSLKKAIGTFLIANVVRTLKGQERAHRSMLINISRFNGLHDKIANAVNDYIDNLMNAVEQKYLYPIESFLKNKECKMLYDIWNTDEIYSNNINIDGIKTKEKYTWDKIQPLLFDELSKFEITIANSQHKKDRYDYEERKQGARVIVVGGFTLSRGLTLEGLMVSYYSRNASAYDVLLQMGRWFGYRPHYEELCMLFISKTNVYCFDAAANSTDELKRLFVQMDEQDKKPSEFGLKVLAKPDTLATNLLITARNKMKNGVARQFIKELGNEVIQTSRLFTDKETNQENFNLVESLIKDALCNGCRFIQSEVTDKYEYLSNVPKELITKFIAKYNSPIQNTTFDPDGIITAINSNDVLNNWDIVISEGDGADDPEIYIANKKIKTVYRSIAQGRDEKYFTTSQKQNNISNPGMFKIGLTLSQYNKIKNSKKSHSISANDYLNCDRNPLLVIYPLHLKSKNSYEDSPEQKIIGELEGVTPVGIALGFPGKKRSIKATYMLNVVALEQYLANEDIDEDAEYEWED